MTPLAIACSLRLEEATEVLIQICKASITGSPSVCNTHLYIQICHTGFYSGRANPTELCSS